MLSLPLLQLRRKKIDTYLNIETFENFYNYLYPNLTTGADRISKKYYQNFTKRSEEFNTLISEIDSLSYKTRKYKNIPLENRTLSIPTIRDRIVFEVLKTSLNTKLKIKFNHRNSNIYSLVDFLKNNTKITVFRLDIEKFFDNIPKNLLLKKLKNNFSISPEEYHIIKQFLKYNKKGIPQGIGLSSLLAEYYLLDLDSELKKLSPKLAFFNRYVDDIIIIFNGKLKSQELNFINQNIETTIKKYHLNLNKDKSLLPASSNFEFLGYQFNLQYDKWNLTDISNLKKEKIKNKINFIFSQYSSNNNYGLLNLRLKYIIWSSTLKKRILKISNKGIIYSRKYYLPMGIFYNYKFLSEKVVSKSIYGHLCSKKDLLSTQHLSHYKNFFLIPLSDTLNGHPDKTIYFRHPLSKEKCVSEIKKASLYNILKYSRCHVKILKREYLKKIIIK